MLLWPLIFGFVDGLSALIERPASIIAETGHPLPIARGLVINTLLDAKIRDPAKSLLAEALATWDRKDRETVIRLGTAKVSVEEADRIIERLEGRRALAEGVKIGFPSQGSVTTAKLLLEGGRASLERRNGPADAAELVQVSGALERELAGLDALLEAMAPRGSRKRGHTPVPAKPQEAEHLRRGASGERVSHLQNRLNTLGHDLRPDGNFGAKTEEAVKDFQSSATLEPDGVVGPITTDALREAPTNVDAEADTPPDPARESEAGAAAGPVAGTPEDPAKESETEAQTKKPARKPKTTEILYKGIGVGDRSGKPAVMELQGQLNQLGHGVDEDGRFGPETEKAVKTFQRKYGLRTDGICAEKTQRTIKGVVAKTEQVAEARQGSLAEATRNRHMCPKCGRAMGAHIKKCPRCSARLQTKGGKDLGMKLTNVPPAFGSSGTLAEADKTKFANMEETLLEAMTDRDLAEVAVEGSVVLVGVMVELGEAKDSLQKASTPEPFSSSRTSNWVARAGGLPPYVQHIAHDLMEKRGKTESNAIQMAIGIVKRWAKGLGGVDANTRAAAAKAMAEWEKMRAETAAKKGAKDAAHAVKKLAAAATEYERGHALAEARLKQADRDKLPKSAFAIPESREYPIHDEEHARKALQLCAGKPEAGRVRAAVKRKYPGVGSDE